MKRFEVFTKTLGVTAILASGIAIGNGAQAQTTMSLSECREVLAMDRNLVRRNVYDACASALAEYDARDVATSSRDPSDPDPTTPTGGGDGSGGSGSGGSLLTITASALRDGLLDASVCAGLSGGSTSTCSLVMVQTSLGPRQMLLDGSGNILDADVDVGGSSLLAASVGGSGQSLLEATVAGGSIAEVSAGGESLVEASVAGGSIAEVSAGGESLVDASVGGGSIADVSVGSGGIDVSVAGIDLLN